MRKTIILAVLAACAGAEPASAQRGVFGGVGENDSVTPADREYTSGLKIYFVSEPEHGRGLARALLRARDGAETRYGVAFGQSIFTPSDLAASAPVPGERPYAGWLYTELSVYARRRSGALDVLTANLGVVGPSALGEESQNTLHSLLDIGEARGWDNQLRDEPALIVSFDRFWRASTADSGFGAEVTPSVGVSAGNVLTQARAGVRLRVGDDLGAEYGAARARPGLPGPGVREQPGDGFGWSIFAGVDGRAVARNIFLDGNTFRDSLSVDKKTLVGDAEIGASIEFGGVEIATSYVWRSREYETQGEPHQFGTLALSARF